MTLLSKQQFCHHLFRTYSVSFVPKRAVFDRPKAEVPNGEGEKGKSAADIAKEAKDKGIGVVLDLSRPAPDFKASAILVIEGLPEKDASPEKRKEAIALLDRYDSEFEAARNSIILHVKADALLAEFGTNFDNLEWQFANIERLEGIQKELAQDKLLQERTKIEIAEKIQAVYDQATAYYGQCNSSAATHIGLLEGDAGATMDNIKGAFDSLGKLQSNKVNQFKGVAFAQFAQATNENITKLLAAIEGARGKLGTEDLSTFTKVYGNGMKVAKFADANFNAVRTGDDAGRKAGAEQYLAMSVAQARAISARESIPQDFHFNSLSPQMQKLYGQALADFSAANVLSANIKQDDSTKAKVLFDKSRDVFLAMKAELDNKQETTKKTKVPSEPEEVPEKLPGQRNRFLAYAEISRDNAIAAWGKVSAKNSYVLSVYANNLAGLAEGDSVFGQVDTILDEGANSLNDQAIEKYKEAKQKYDTFVEKCDQALVDYGRMQASRQSRFNAAIEHIKGFEEGHSTDSYSQVIVDYANDPRAWEKKDALKPLYWSFSPTAEFEKDGIQYKVTRDAHNTIYVTPVENS